ncbi:MAG: hypothetical protein PHE26_08365, partial [Syntrophomonadaceae bacterium]|nr:hypothetical protein [Syntrophomonadaceae bacterium]
MQTALENLGTIGTGNVEVSYNATVANPRYEIKFLKDLASMDVPAVGFTPVETFTGVANFSTVAGNSPQLLDFGVTPQGGPANSAFTITFGSLPPVTTGPIMVGADGDETAANIETALNAAGLDNGAVADVTWNDIANPNTYTISFTADPGAITAAAAVAANVFTGGPDHVDNFDPIDPGFNPDPLNCRIISQDVYDTQGNKYPVYFRFFKYGIELGPPTVSNWGCDVSLDPRFEEAPGYSSTVPNGYAAIDMSLGGPNSDLQMGDQQIRRLYNIQFDTLGN